MRRFFCPITNITKDKIVIDNKEQVHHIKDVLRLRVKDNVTVFDDQGNEYNCIIEKITNEVILGIKRESPVSYGIGKYKTFLTTENHLKVIAKRFSCKKEGIKITVACAIPKKSKMDDIIDKLTQLGVDRIIPLETQRVIVRLDDKKKKLRRERWQKIALNAAQQSQRETLPVIEPIKNMREVLIKSENYDLKLIPTLTIQGKPLKEIFAQTKAKDILVLIGPEGDFTSQEVALAVKAGCIPVTLGDTVLRVDTAAIAVTGYLRFALGALVN